MKPYWQSGDGLVTLYHADMREACDGLRADAVITDGPFAVGDKSIGARRAGRRWGNIKIASTAYHAASEWDAALDSGWCVSACKAAPVVAWFGAGRRRRAFEDAMPYPLRCEIIWAKNVHVGPPCPAAMRDERIWIFSAETYAGQCFETTVWDEAIIPTWQRRYHKNQKPLPLMARLIRWVCPPEATILDPFAGSGSTLVAAFQMGRKCIGVELDEEHCETAAMRLGAARPDTQVPGPLFGGAA